MAATLTHPLETSEDTANLGNNILPLLVCQCFSQGCPVLAGKARVGMEPSDMAELPVELLLTGLDGWGRSSIFLTDPAWKLISAPEAAESRSLGIFLQG